MAKLPVLRQWDAVVIEWEDIVGSSGEWSDIEQDNTETMVCLTRGFIYAGWSRKAKTLKVCSTVSRDMDISHRDAVPKGCINDITIEGRKRKMEWIWDKPKTKK